jgi:hypothetical protein
MLKATALAGGALLAARPIVGRPLLAASPSAPTSAPASSPGEARDRYITCFYQYNHLTLQSLAGPGGLPNGPQYLHIFSISHEGHKAHPQLTKDVQACGPSFKYARAIDIWKYKGWQIASDEQLRQWAIEFRAEALPPEAPADYFAFNEMPAGAESNPALQSRIAKWMRYLHDPADGRPRLPAVFYLVEENLDPASWKGSAIDDLWAAIDETSALAVGEHYHDLKFLADRTPEQFTDHLFALAKWLDASGKPAQQNIARHKYAVLHSTYYGPDKNAWQGLQLQISTPAQFKVYLVNVTSASRRIP